MKASFTHRFSLATIGMGGITMWQTMASVLTALTLTVGTANAATTTIFAVSGTDEQEVRIDTFMENGCAQTVCNIYEPGTFSGTLGIDLSTDTVTAVDIEAGTGVFGNRFVSPPGYMSGLSFSLDLYVLGVPSPVGPNLVLSIDLSNDTVTGFVSGVSGVSPESGFTADFVKDMQGSLVPTPLPLPLTLFASGLGGLGLLGWRRKRKL